jgi:16S rRNA (cytosine967-C5)-methyltransferase
VRVLWRRERGGRYVEELLDAELARAACSPADRRLAQELTFGVTRRLATLDWIIARQTGGREQKPALRALLRAGLYQLFWLDRVPDHAAIHETVELAKRMGFGPQAGFINAVLRHCARDRELIRRDLKALETAAPHVAFSHPQWLVERWQRRWGAEDAARLLAWNNTAPGTFARVNTLKTDAATLLERWREEGVEYDFGRWDWIEENLVFALKSHPPLNRLASFRDGGFYVQDPSTLLAVACLDPGPGETILDLCAAPGGKTTLIAQRLRNEGRIVACDTDKERLRLLGENCARLGVTCVAAVLIRDDWPADLAAQRFDRILVDAPCSNTGVLRRRVDLRWRLRPEEIRRLGATQLSLLRRAAGLLRPGGTLVYSTCSLEPEENSEVVRQFLADAPRFKLGPERELVPFRDGVDGAYVARLDAG